MHTAGVGPGRVSGSGTPTSTPPSTTTPASPDVILKRIARREEETPAGSLSRSAHRDDEVPSGSVGALVTDLAMMHGFQVPEAHSLAAAIERLVSLPPEQRASITRLILTLDSNRDDE